MVMILESRDQTISQNTILDYTDTFLRNNSVWIGPENLLDSFAGGSRSIFLHFRHSATSLMPTLV